MQDAWAMAFGPQWAKELTIDRINELPWSEYSARLTGIHTPYPVDENTTTK